MSFINTIDLLGDDIVLKSIIEGTIVEYKDELQTELRSHAFNSCAELETISLPNLITMGQYAFECCSKLKNVEMPKLEKVGQGCFSDCTSLQSIDLPKLTQIPMKMFLDCNALNTVILRYSNFVSLGGTNAFTDTLIANGTGYIYVPKALIERYKAATNWSVYADQFRALEDYTVDGTITGELDESKIAA